MNTIWFARVESALSFVYPLVQTQHNQEFHSGLVFSTNTKHQCSIQRKIANYVKEKKKQFLLPKKGGHQIQRLHMYHRLKKIIIKNTQTLIFLLHIHKLYPKAKLYLYIYLINKKRLKKILCKVKTLKPKIYLYHF